MTPRELLLLNGDFVRSPLLDSLRRVDTLFTARGIPYAVVGGLAVLRWGAGRTTMDIDILVGRDDWAAVTSDPPDFLETGRDWARDRKNGVDIDILFPGNEWDMEIPLPQPEDIGERSEDLGALFAGLVPLLTIKCAVYRKKLAEDGIEIAAKDLSDLAALLRIHGKELNDGALEAVPPVIARALLEIRSRVDTGIP